MSERISIFNYEAFYLDFLEGNLNEKDTALLFAFFEEHPECKLEGELPVLDIEKVIFDDKNNLKQVNDDAIITSLNVEHFLISEVENTLSHEKAAELQDFVASNSHLKRDALLYKKTILTANQDIVFENKGELKQSRAIRIAPFYWSAAAAAILFFVFLRGFNFESFEKPFAQVVNPRITPSSVNSFALLTNSERSTIFNLNDIQFSAINSNKYNNYSVLTKSKDIESLAQPISTKPVRNVLNQNYDKPLEPLAISPHPVALENENVSVAVNNDLINPIEPITAFVSKKTNVEIDYKQRKKTENKKGGFFIKLGKFELSRNTH